MMKKTTTLYLNYLTKYWNLNKTLTLAGISTATLSAQAQNIPLVFDPMSKYAYKGIVQGSNIMQTFADVDGDGDLDIVTNGANYKGLLLFRNIGSNAGPNYQLVAQTASEFGQFNNYMTFPDNENMGYGAVTAFADIDGDGKTDMVLSRQDYYYARLHLYYKNIGSNATPKYSLLVGSDNPGLPFSTNPFLGYLKPTFADIDGDRKQDLVYADSKNGILSFFKNISTGFGNFNFKSVTGTANPFAGISIGYNGFAAFNDADGDGLTDLIVVDKNSSNYITFFKNTGANSSPVYVQLLNASTDNPFSGITGGMSTIRTASFVDMDGDGKSDLITNATDDIHFSNSFRGLITHKRVITGGKTSFVKQNPVKTPLAPFLASIGNYQSLNYIDFDGDGDMDMYQIKTGADSLANNRFFFYKNIGTIVTPSWQEFKGTNAFGIQTSSIYDFIQFADIDNDGKKEGIWFKNNDRSNILYLKNTGSNLAPSFATYQNADTANPFSELNSGGGKFYPAFADLNTDGLLDIVVSNYNNSSNLKFFKNTGSKTQPGFALWTEPSLTGSSGNNLSFTQIADIDLDGKPDLIFGGDNGKPEIYLNKTTLSSSPSFVYLQPNSANPFNNLQDFSNSGRIYPSLADLDGDGDVDLHVIAGDYYNKQSFVFKNSLRNPIGPTAQSSTKALASPAILSFNSFDFTIIKGTYNLASVKITALPTQGVLSLSGAALTSIPVVVPIAALGNLSFAATDKSYTGQDAFSFIAIDAQGFQSATATLTINITKSTITGISNAFESKVDVYPNPFDNQVFVKISEGITGEVSISLTDALGTTLKSTSFTKPQGSLAYPFSTVGLASGLYFIRIAYGDMVEVKKIVKE